MREILFIGKLSHNNKWVVGNLVFSQEGNPYIIPSDIIEQDGHHLRIFDDNAYWVNNNTIGQYTGLKDKNGTKIFEGDIIKDVSDGVVFTVFYADGGFAIESNPVHFGYGYQGNSNPRESLSDMQTGSYVEGNCVVIGNIHDNKDLLK